MGQECDRIMMEFALWTGLGEGEMFNLELIDLRVGDTKPEVIVRFGSKGEPPKNGKIRQVPLFGRGLSAAKRWLELLPSYAPKNPEKLAFPGRRGGRRSPGKNFHTTRTILDKKGKTKAVKVDVFREHLLTAGIEATKRHDGRLPRWHDLRHSCGSSLVAGWWRGARERFSREQRSREGHARPWHRS